MKVFPPKRRMRIYAFALVAFGSAGALFCHFSEPTYKGESLSEWLSQSGERYLWMPIASKTTNEEMVEAVTHIGPKGIPTLLKMLQRQQPRWQHVVENWLSSLPWLPQPNFEDRSDEENYGAVVGFGILKNAAYSAIPELEQMLYRTNTCERAAAALNALGPHTTPILLKGATKDESLVRQSSIYALYLFPTNTFDLTDQMQRWRKDTNEIVAYHATGWLWEHRPASERLELVRDALKDGRRMPVQIGLFLLPKLEIGRAHV